MKFFSDNGRIDRRNSINVSKDVLNYSTQNTVQDGEETFTTNVSDIPGNLQEVEIIGTAPRKP